MFCRAAASTARSGSSPVLERPSVARTTPATGWPRCAASTPCERVAQRARSARFGWMSSSLRACAAFAEPGLGRRFEVVDIQLPALRTAPPGSARSTVLTSSSRGVSRSRSTGDFPPADSQLQAAASRQRRESSVYGSENLMLSESSTTIARCDGTVSRCDETSTGSSSMAATASRSARAGRPASTRFGPRQIAALPAIEPPEQDARAAAIAARTRSRSRRSRAGRRRELELRVARPVTTPGDDDRSPGAIARSCSWYLQIRSGHRRQRERPTQVAKIDSTISRTSSAHGQVAPDLAAGRGEEMRPPSPLRRRRSRRPAARAATSARPPRSARGRSRAGRGWPRRDLAGCPAAPRPRRGGTAPAWRVSGTSIATAGAAVARVLGQRARPSATAARRRRAGSAGRWRSAGWSGRPAASARRP